MWEYLSVDVPHVPDQPENRGALTTYLEQGWQVVAYVPGGRRQFGGGGTIELDDPGAPEAHEGHNGELTAAARSPPEWPGVRDPCRGCCCPTRARPRWRHRHLALR